MDPCRVCENKGFYDIFNDELSIENNKSIKIYIVLNNFLFEKVLKLKLMNNKIIKTIFF